MFHDHAGYTFGFLSRRGHLDKGEVAIAVVVVGHKNEATLKGAVDVDLIVGHLTLLSVRDREVSIVGATLGEVITQRLC